MGENQTEGQIYWMESYLSGPVGNCLVVLAAGAAWATGRVTPEETGGAEFRRHIPYLSSATCARPIWSITTGGLNP